MNIAANFKARLKRHEPLLGPFVSLASTEVAEIMAQVGFDYIWIDMEHAPIDLAKAQAMIQATAGRCACLVRTPWNDGVWIKRILDTGCDGIIVPQIRSASEARDAVAACQYPPEGIRSIGIARAQGYGITLQDCLARANERLCIVLQIEHMEAVSNIQAITEVPGFDAIVIGQFDLSGSMGLPGQTGHSDVQKAVSKVKAVCKMRGIPIGVFAPNAGAAKAHIASDCTLIALGMDIMYLWKAAKQTLSEVKEQA